MTDEETGKWPLSCYPILMAAVLLVTVAIALKLGGNEAYADQLAIYAYSLLAIGIAIRFFELTLPETFILRLKAKLPKINRDENSSKASEDSTLDFFTDITKNVFLLLLIFFLIALSYGVLVDWFPVEGFIKELGYIIIIFFVLHLVLRVSYELFDFKEGGD